VSQDNLRFWNELGKTDPSQTKQFTRSGGFRGTAIKPIWCDKRMTEVFGPVGSGWGTTEPRFESQHVGEEALVFCTVGLWYKEGDRKSEVFYGVGGDKFLIRTNGGIRTSDEAYKSAYTDALGNAMKLLGVAADIHMGLFDDHKYVRDLKEEFAEKNGNQEEPEKEPEKPKIQRKKQNPLRADLISIIKGFDPLMKDTFGTEMKRQGFNSPGEIPDDLLADVLDFARGL
jgi:hypothetical protein